MVNFIYMQLKIKGVCNDKTNNDKPNCHNDNSRNGKQKKIPDDSNDFLKK